VRAAVWTFIACAFLCVVGVFLPTLELNLTGPSVAMRKGGKASLYEISNSQDTLRRVIGRYRESTARRVGTKVLGKVAPHLEGRLAGDASELQEAIDVLDTIKDEDIKLVGTITTATMWTLIGLEVVVVLLVLGVTARSGRLRVAGALVVAFLGAALAVAIHLVLRRVVAEANSEIERELFFLQIGAYVIPLAAVAGAGAMIWLLVAHARAHRLAAPPPRSP
jgi:hypothetical protein